MGLDFDREQRRYDNLCPTDFGYNEEEDDEKLDYEDEDERQVFDEYDEEYRQDRMEREGIENAQNAWEKRNKL